MTTFGEKEYREIFNFFKKLYYRKNWSSAFDGKKDDGHIREIFHEALIRSSKLEKEQADINKIMERFLFDSLRFPNEEAFKAYLAVTFTNFIVDRARTKRSEEHEGHYKEEPLTETIEATRPTPECSDSSLTQAELRNIATNIVDYKIDRETGDLLSLYFNEGMTYLSIAHALGRSTSAVDRRMKKAYAVLREFIEKEMAGGRYTDEDYTTVLHFILDRLAFTTKRRNTP